MLATTASSRAFRRLSACAVLALLLSAAACGGDDDAASGVLESGLGADYAQFIRAAINGDGDLGRICGDMRDDLASGEATAEEKDDRKRLVPVCDMAEDGDADGALARLDEVLPHDVR